MGASMIESIGISALKDLAKSLGKRLMTSPNETVSVKVMAEIAALRLEQYQGQLTTMEVMNQFALIIGQVNGLAQSGNGITYRQTEQAPTLGDSLLLLHRRIDELARQSAPPTVIVVSPEARQEISAASSPVTSPSPTYEPPRVTPSASGRRRDVFDEIDKEIERRRSQGGERQLCMSYRLGSALKFISICC
jgi:hypothetical protein